jgi:hypothetical protein
VREGDLVTRSDLFQTEHHYQSCRHLSIGQETNARKGITGIHAEALGGGQGEPLPGP